MLRASRNYQHKDYSYMLACMQNDNQKCDPPVGSVPCERAPEPTKPVVTAEARRRARLMNNRSMRYIISTVSGEKHDRDCPHAARIPDAAFDMVEDFPGWEGLCRRCSRRAVIREGLHADLTKYLDAAAMLLGKMDASTRLLHSLFHKHGGRIFRIETDSLYIKVREDSWILQYTDEGCLLYHNNYYVLEDYSRVISEGYHLQLRVPLTFSLLFAVITGYSWALHVKIKKEEVLAARAEEMRGRLATVANYVALPGSSLLCSYFLVADSYDHIEQMLKQSKLPARLVTRGRYPDTGCSDGVYRVWKWNCRNFLNIVEGTKDYSVRQRCLDYADFCESKIKPPTGRS